MRGWKAGHKRAKPVNVNVERNVTIWEVLLLLLYRLVDTMPAT